MQSYLFVREIDRTGTPFHLIRSSAVIRAARGKWILFSLVATLRQSFIHAIVFMLDTKFRPSYDLVHTGRKPIQNGSILIRES